MHEEEWWIRMYKSINETDIIAETKYVLFYEIMSTLKKANEQRIRFGHVQNAMKKLKWNEKIMRRVNGVPRYVLAVAEKFSFDQFVGKLILNEM